MRLGNDDLIEAGTETDMGSNINSVPIPISSIVNYSIQLSFSGTPNGSLKLQVSDDLGQISQSAPVDSEKVTNWTDYDGSEQAITEAGNHSWQVQNDGFRWVRFVWTDSDGDGTLETARFQVKGA